MEHHRPPFRKRNRGRIIKGKKLHFAVMELNQTQQPAIVLTADESLMSNFKHRIYYGFAPCFPTNILVESELNKFCPPVRCHPDGRAKIAPLSLRAVESVLHKSGFKQGEYAIVHPKYLNRFVGPKTRIVGVSTIDPKGVGPITKTLRSLYGGESYTMKFFNSTMEAIKTLKKKHHVKVVVGGPGAWQLSSETTLDSYGIDYLVMGEAENIIPQLFMELVDGRTNRFPRIITGKPAMVEDIPPIIGATTNGLVEVSRGCGRGCTWCFSSTAGGMRCLPVETIKKSAETNATNGVFDITLQSDDALLYGSKPKRFVPDSDAVLTLLKELYSTEGVRSVSFLHFSAASIVADPDIIPRITAFMKSHDKRTRKHFEVQIGIETGSPHMIEKYMRGKALPFKPNEWPTIVKKASQILKENGWFCYATLILGLPEEKAEDITQTIDLIKNLRNSRMAFIPLFFVPVATLKLKESSDFFHENIMQKYGLLFHELRKHNEKIASRYRRHKHILDFFLFTSNS
ncbi:MAG: radical SAM protein [Nitrososphaerota archaeon]|nr:B12-binding domain-containing radical SAM protein [Candidatus Bathyarchaeota archaeon]MDW8022199.1 radical SAM protein [Nitrososphaerota archaeon]